MYKEGDIKGYCVPVVYQKRLTETTKQLNIMIIGIVLIVDELHKGPRLVYRYPDHIPPSTYDTVEDDITRLHKEYLSMR